jgi:hypothetical protein
MRSLADDCFGESTLKQTSLSRFTRMGDVQDSVGRTKLIRNFAFDIHRLMKFRIRKLLAASFLGLGLAGFSNAAPPFFAPTSEEQADFDQFVLNEKPNSDEALVYVGNYALDENQRFRPFYVAVGEIAKALDGNTHMVLRLTPGLRDVSMRGVCAKKTPVELAAIVDESRSGVFNKDLLKKPDEPRSFLFEAGKTYFLVATGACILNRYDGFMHLHGGIGTLKEEHGKYMVFKTTKVTE